MEEKFKSLNTSLEEIDRLYQKQTDLEKENANAQQLIQKLTKEQSIAENELSKLLLKAQQQQQQQQQQKGIDTKSSFFLFFFTIDNK